MMHTKDEFLTWKLENLAGLASELHEDNAKLREANEQLRLDLRDAMKLVRQQHKETQ
jgi:hypothetical protein